MSNTTVVPISMPKAMAKELDREAKARAMTRSEFVRDSVRRQLGFGQSRERAIEAAIAEGLADIKAGRVSGPFSSVEEFNAHLKRQRV